MSSRTKRLGVAVKMRRLSLGLSHDEVKQAGGPSDTTVSKIENDAAGVPARITLQRLDTALRWEPGSARAVMDGGQPTPIADSPAGLDAYSDVELAAELLRRLTEGRDGHDQQPAPIDIGTATVRGPSREALDPEMPEDLAARQVDGEPLLEGRRRRQDEDAERPDEAPEHQRSDAQDHDAGEQG